LISVYGIINYFLKRRTATGKDGNDGF
jgi:hypothetical protein